MMLLPGFGKKHAAAAVFAAAAVAVGWAGVSRLAPRGAQAPALQPSKEIVQQVQAEAKPVTAGDYRSAAAEAAKLFVAGDAGAADKLLSALVAIRVPREEMDDHLELTTAVAAYRDALAAGDAAASAAALSRLRAFAESNPWCGLKP